jgi:antitoxin component of MazEF toxin-antitoxin module
MCATSFQLEEGNYLEASIENDAIVLKPKVMVDRRSENEAGTVRHTRVNRFIPLAFPVKV